MAAIPFIFSKQLLPDSVVKQVPQYFDPISAVKASIVLMMAPQMVRVTLQMTTNGHFDNVQPRLFLEKDLARNMLIQRIHSAHLNAIENFPIFTVSAVFATMMNTEKEATNRLCTLYVLARAGFNLLYGLADNDLLAGLRSIAWLIGCAASSRLLDLAREEYVKKNGKVGDN